MKKINILNLIISLLFSMVCITTGFGQNTKTQDSVVTISNQDAQNRHLYYFNSETPWLYHNGTNNAWSQPNIDLEGWKKLSPKDLNETYADKNGIIEGWFRIKIKLDDSFKNEPLRLRYSGMAAAEVFVDGKLYGTYGNLGSETQDFRFFSENDPSSRIDLSLNETHTIAIHIKDKLIYPTQISGSMIGFQTGWSKCFFLILQTDNEHYLGLLNKSRSTIYFTLWAAINLIIGFLFLFLFTVNKKEKNILIYSGVCLSMGINGITTYLFNFAGFLDFQPSTILCLSLANGLTFSLIFILLYFSIFKIFAIKLAGLNRWIHYTYLILIITNIVGNIISVYTSKYDDVISLFSLIVVLVFILIIIYWTIVSFRHLSLPQKVIAFGIILFVLLCVIFLIAVSVFNMYLGSTIAYNLISALYFCFPIALLIYVVLRFQEINKNVVLKAEEILTLSEEKREMAEGQQKLLEHQVAERTEDLQKSLTDLKATQSQLIQSEKMASLGELTAGIAHEIQNPLNFVNNFSEVSTELIDEMHEELDNGDLDEAKAISNDIKQNLEKINHHGKRADDIVKGMLQHSRKNTGEKELTDINKLADEYFRLAYHGLRAKDKSFNAQLETDYDDSIKTINIIPQDIGRVILNLITNAFYAVDEKKSNSESKDFKPTVSVSTKNLKDTIEIHIEDNGNGIPKDIVDKIFQPFFTTKPTGKGTGLGLSMSYDIIKAHAGELRVKSEDKNGTRFIVSLPVQ